MNLKNCRIERIEKKECAKLINEYHYLGKQGYHRTMPNVKMFMVDASPIKYDDEISDLIASTIEEFLGIVFADEDIA